MSTENTDYYKLVLREIQKWGFLLESDPSLPSVCTLITREPLRGSWWSHPMAQTIFQVNEKLEDHPDLIITKLVSKKVTFVHRTLWADLLAIGSAREPWQMRKLTASAKTLLKSVNAEGAVSTERLAMAKPGDAARELEFRLLVHSQQFHTESGKHAKRLETWERWAGRAGIKTSLTADQAKKRVEEIVQKLNQEFDGSVSLPWQIKGRSPK